jgi:DNA modification methylase
MQNQLLMQKVPLDSLKEPAAPLRRHSAAKQRKLKKSLDHYGMLVPLLVAKGEIVDGVARVEAAKAIGLQHVPVIDISHLSSNEIRALRLALNRLQEEVQWDRKAVAHELRHLIDIGFEIDLTGFDTVEIENHLEIGEPDGDVEDLNVSIAPRIVVTRLGDIWTGRSKSGQHRIACGDARDIELRHKLFIGQMATACFTDPPYNVVVRNNVSSTGKHAEFAMASGEMTDAEFLAFLETILDVIFIQLTVNGVAFVCMDWRHIGPLLNAGVARDLELINVVIWNKSNPGMGSFYRSQHEMIAVFKRKGQPHRNNIELGRHGRSRSNVWSYRGVNVFGPERHLLSEHPTVKPSNMVADAIRDVTLPGEVIFDPFLGSGSTLIASERTSRTCFGIEIEPKFVDLAIRRWEIETGESATRLGDGATFKEAEEAAILADLPNKGKLP